MELSQIKATLLSDSGRALREYLTLKLNELKDIDNVDGTVIDLKSQKKAYKKLREILTEIGEFSEEIKTKDKRDSFQVL